MVNAAHTFKVPLFRFCLLRPVAVTMSSTN